MNKFDKFLTKALDKMFTYVGFEKFDQTFTSQDDWFEKKTWSQSQSEEFKCWFINECKKDLKFTKKMAEKEHAWFDLKWGWKVNYND
jgi:hypothetical protein